MDVDLPSQGVKQWRRAIQRTFQLGVGKEAESSIDEKVKIMYLAVTALN
jgi:hypothetical protein